MKKLGILGSGIVSKVLAAGFKGLGYNVMMGTGSPEKLAEFSQKEGTPVGSFQESAAFGEILILAVKGAAAEGLLQSLDPASIAGKIIIDTTNPIDDSKPPVDGVLSFFTGPNESLMERLQSSAPEARLVKAFNSVGNPKMVHPQYPGGQQPTMFMCGNDEAARGEVSDILRQLGWNVLDLGRATAARAIEPLCILWCIPGFAANEWTHALKMLHA